MVDLGGVELFRGLSEDDLREFAGWFDVQTVGAGVKIVSPSVFSCAMRARLG
jgi:hypothetical protein